MEAFFVFYQYVIYFYATALTLIYSTLALMAYFNIIRSKQSYSGKEERILKKHPESAPGISIVAPAFNEEVIIIDNVSTLLNLDYPNFEVVIVNDGSKDKTLDLLIEHFALTQVPYAYVSKVPCKPVKRIFRSTDPQFERLTVVDKINGGTKSDAMNAGVNVARHNYFINTDVDCLLAKDTLTKVILPVMDSDVEVIAVGATMRMSNGCKVDNGEITEVRPPKGIIPAFQEVEYMRSYLVAKMGWARINAVTNVSGGFGLFNKEIVIEAGGFDPLSHAEDLDMTLRIIAHKRDNNEQYRIVQVPDTLCWTEGPPNLKVLSRQRTRWGRGLLQIFFVHRKFLFNRKYGRMGWIMMPYIFIFEFLAPIFEFFGLLCLFYLLWTGQVNFNTFWLMLGYVYLLGTCVSLLTISYDLTVKKLYNNLSEYLKLILFASFEAFVYHPLTIVFTLRGYVQFLTGRNFKWGEMTRQGHSKNKPQNKLQVTK
ncbi:family 2 glycosyl transferase [Galbibacter marinus]|uniref:Family 2 glycosyl transferase n=1 Tax=Galbibacter marinus TaxID=555500 RepID=K2PNR6_9FLAO|nr:glycosyltransferase [Galbibacter marinus]EKF54175.1 family 2 glycosyl transferase [Galbibacter marinus]